MAGSVPSYVITTKGNIGGNGNGQLTQNNKYISYAGGAWEGRAGPVRGALLPTGRSSEVRAHV